ncbi:capsular polysaccharide biosynthesis protein [Rhizobium soli]|uniref:Capsular polysaccharide biosynthesis protein n=1 Tax=Rhizobium soli TaxID=424798 RepID=A0A7X0JP04_9HYPH|nr:glycosyltransferase 61 family protein [Rhizobium soli]MBB6511138.1 capsular polysaccharide biosynthesis protein [Rhizobium soli]
MDTPLSIVFERGAYASAFKVARPSYEIEGAIYNRHGVLVPSSQRLSGVKGDRVFNIDPPNREFSPDVKRLPGRSIYLGHLMGHYGHFLTETTSTFWALAVAQNVRPVMHPFIFGAEIKSFMKPFFEAYGIQDVHIIEEDTFFEELLVPERTFRVNTSGHEEQKNVFDHVRAHVSKSGWIGATSSMLFVSRGKLDDDPRNFKNGDELEAEIEKLGFQIIYPEQHDINDQIRMFANCRIVCGFPGSALHSSVFMDRGSLVIELGDNRSPNNRLWNQIACDELSLQKGIFIPLMVRTDSILDVARTIKAISEALASEKLNLAF